MYVCITMFRSMDRSKHPADRKGKRTRERGSCCAWVFRQAQRNTSTAYNSQHSVWAYQAKTHIHRPLHLAVSRENTLTGHTHMGVNNCCGRERSARCCTQRSSAQCCRPRSYNDNGESSIGVSIGNIVGPSNTWVKNNATVSLAAYHSPSPPR